MVEAKPASCKVSAALSPAIPPPTIAIRGSGAPAFAIGDRERNTDPAAAPTPCKNLRRPVEAVARSSRTVPSSTPRHEASACSEASRWSVFISGERAIIDPQKDFPQLGAIRSPQDSSDLRPGHVLPEPAPAGLTQTVD